jgi:hypothetical protein
MNDTNQNSGSAATGGYESDDRGSRLQRLEEIVSQASVILRELKAESLWEEETQPSDHPNSLDKLREELSQVEADRNEVLERMIEAEQMASRIMSLYVATYQLHSTLDPTEVTDAIGEIAIDLLGAESFALLVRENGESPIQIALAKGADFGPGSPFLGEIYKGGDAQVDASLEDGVLRIGKIDGSDAIAVVPLRLESETVGVLVIFSVLEHKSSPLQQDRELLDLLSAHAGSAMVAAVSYSATDRRLRTLKDLVSLLPGT